MTLPSFEPTSEHTESVRTTTIGWACVIAILVLTCAATVYRAALKPFWYDELFTVYLVRLGSFHRTWDALRAGADLNPPLLYLATAFSEAVLGPGPVSARIPAIAGYLVFMLGLFSFTTRRLPLTYGLQAMLFPIVLGSYEYAFEARSYGMVLGFAGIALVCWQRAAARQGRGVWTLGLAVALAGALLTHCYAVLILPALFAGEAARAMRNKRIDWRMWAGLILPCSAISIYFPLLQSSRGYQLTSPIFDPTLPKLPASYIAILLPALIPAFLTLLFLAYFSKPSPQRVRARIAELRSKIPEHEMAAVAVFMLTPVIGLVLAMVVKGGFFPRYVLEVGIGFSLLFSWTCFVLAGAAPKRVHALPVFLLIWFAVTFLVQDVLGPRIQVPPDAVVAKWKASGEQPLVIMDGLTFLQLDYYLDDKATSRLFFLTDRPSALRYMGTDCYDRTMKVVGPWFPLRGHVTGYQDFVSSHPSFLLYGTTSEETQWILKKLQADGASTTSQLQLEERALIQVRYRANDSVARRDY